MSAKKIAKEIAIIEKASINLQAGIDVTKKENMSLLAKMEDVKVQVEILVAKLTKWIDVHVTHGHAKIEANNEMIARAEKLKASVREGTDNA